MRYRLAANQDKSFQGSIVLGMGFVLTPEEAQALIAKDPRNKDVLFPYLNGEDLNSRPYQHASRWVINFFDWPLDAEHDDPKKPKRPPYATDYPDCLAIVREKVKHEREDLRDTPDGRRLKQRWWQFCRTRTELYSAITEMERVLVFAQTSKTKCPTFVTNGIVYDQKVVVIASNKSCLFSILCSHIHYWWVLAQGCSLRTDAVYTPTDCFETFPLPLLTSNLNEIGERYYTHRQSIMQTRQEGLTKTYNRFHNLDENATDIQKMRELHVEMDNAVAAAYGWTDLDLGHGFHETKQGLRYTISEAARREVLDRLLQLNHQRYVEEVAAGLRDKGKKKGKAGSSKTAEVKASPGQVNFF